MLFVVEWSLSELPMGYSDRAQLDLPTRIRFPSFVTTSRMTSQITSMSTKRSCPASSETEPPNKQPKTDDIQEKVNQAIEKMGRSYCSTNMEEVLGEDRSKWVERSKEWLAYEHEKPIIDMIDTFKSAEHKMKSMRSLYHRTRTLREHEMEAWDEESECHIWELIECARCALSDATRIRKMLLKFEECL